MSYRDMSSKRRVVVSSSIAIPALPTIIPTITPTITTTPIPVSTLVPEPTFVPTVLPALSISAAEFKRILNRVLGQLTDKAYRVADCEVGYKISAGIDVMYLNRTEVGSQGEVSVFQIHPIHFDVWSRELLQSNLEYAAQAALALSHNGVNWSAWPTCGYR